MPRPRNVVPRFCVDSSGRAFTKVDGKFITLGRGDTAESRERYSKVLENISRAGRVVVQDAPKAATRVTSTSFIRISDTAGTIWPPRLEPYQTRLGA